MLETLLGEKVGFEEAFKKLVRKYRIEKKEADYLYRFFYKLIIHYHTIKFLAGLKGFRPTPSQIVEFLYRKDFSISSILEEARDEAKNLSPIFRLAVLYGYPPWFVGDLYGKMPEDQLEKMLQSLNEKKRWVVVNTSKYTVEDAVNCFQENGIAVEQHSYWKELLLVKDPFLKISNLPCVKNGGVIPQDVSSYILVNLVTQYSGNLIDACSAPGIKLSLILSKSSYSRIVAVDLSENRVEQLTHVVKRIAGLKPVLVVVNGDSRVLAFNMENSIVFIDAPCSNTGSIYANPTVKLYLTRRFVKRMSRNQFLLIKNALKQGKTVIYAVCSIHPREGEEVISRIIEEAWNVELVKPSMHFAGNGYFGYPFSKSIARIYPHDVNGQGFFISLIEKR